MIIVVPKKTLTAEDKKNLLKKGYVVIECEKPESVRIISPETMIDKSDLFLSALSAIVSKHPISGSEKFVAELHNRLIPVKPDKQQKPENKKSVVDSKTVLKEPISNF